MSWADNKLLAYSWINCCPRKGVLNKKCFVLTYFLGKPTVTIEINMKTSSSLVPAAETASAKSFACDKLGKKKRAAEAAQNSSSPIRRP